MCASGEAAVLTAALRLRALPLPLPPTPGRGAFRRQLRKAADSYRSARDREYERVEVLEGAGGAQTSQSKAAVADVEDEVRTWGPVWYISQGFGITSMTIIILSL